mmetsp:Transcript_39809/g.89172  ORF Transcript_39809/g.89172 Transcript_39809/m.89172 type:complete len:463 (-) Transcript_39809:588-1976(-)
MGTPDSHLYWSSSICTSCFTYLSPPILSAHVMRAGRQSTKWERASATTSHSAPATTDLKAVQARSTASLSSGVPGGGAGAPCGSFFGVTAAAWAELLPPSSAARFSAAAAELSTEMICSKMKASLAVKAARTRQSSWTPRLSESMQIWLRAPGSDSLSLARSSNLSSILMQRLGSSNMCCTTATRVGCGMASKAASSMATSACACCSSCFPAMPAGSRSFMPPGPPAPPPPGPLAPSGPVPALASMVSKASVMVGSTRSSKSSLLLPETKTLEVTLVASNFTSRSSSSSRSEKTSSMAPLALASAGLSALLRPFTALSRTRQLGSTHALRKSEVASDASSASGLPTTSPPANSPSSPSLRFLRSASERATGGRVSRKLALAATPRMRTTSLLSSETILKTGRRYALKLSRLALSANKPKLVAAVARTMGISSSARAVKASSSKALSSAMLFWSLGRQPYTAG